MPIFEITAPDGSVYEVEGPEGSTEQQALEQVQKQQPVQYDFRNPDGMNQMVEIATGMAGGMGGAKLIGETAKRYGPRFTKWLGNKVSDLSSVPSATIQGGIAGGIIDGSEGAKEGAAVSTGASMVLNSLGMGGRMAGGAYRTSRDALFPERKAGETLKSFAADPQGMTTKLQSVDEFVPGSAATTTEALGDAGVARLDKTLSNKSADFKQRKIETESARNEARKNYLDEIAGTPEQVEALEAARDAALLGLRTKAGQTKGIDATPIISGLRRAIGSGVGQREVVSKPLKKILEKVEGSSVSVGGQATGRARNVIDGDQLIGIRDHINDEIASLAKANAADKDAAIAQLIRARNALDKEVNKLSPEWGEFLRKYPEESAPIDRKKILQAVQKRVVDPHTGKLQGRQLSRVMEDQRLPARATGFSRAGNLENALEPDQMARLQNIKSDMQRQTKTMELAAAQGSDTLQNSASLAQLGGVASNAALSRVPGGRMAGAALDVLMNPIEHRYQSALADALLDPRAALKAIEAAERGVMTEKQKQILMQLMRGTSAGITSGAGAVAAQ